MTTQFFPALLFQAVWLRSDNETCLQAALFSIESVLILFVTEFLCAPKKEPVTLLKVNSGCDSHTACERMAL